MGASIVSGLIFGLCAFLMLGIGIYQVRSKKPVGFYSGEEAPDERELSDVNAWNKKHGVMWILYGICIICAWVCGLLIGDSLLVLVPFTIGLLVPIPFMIFYHHLLIKKYYINNLDFTRGEKTCHKK